ncbi:hypothetical protein [Nocardia takedensis]|uniref:hypothetical protein n=1 Tax=Nocardia takedensis TaxID=259390 RepID=UPI0012F67B77|nr:hypothetical protein [Nocardia takedensis]
MPHRGSDRADLEVVEKNLRTALSYASNCYAAYLAASPQTRRLFNQAFFEKVYIEQDYVRADLAEPFKTLLGGGLVTAATGTEGEATTPEVTTYVEEGDHRPAVDGVELMDLIRHAPAGDAFAQLSDVENEKPTPYGVGLKATILVPSAGYTKHGQQGSAWSSGVVTLSNYWWAVASAVRRSLVRVALARALRGWERGRPALFF